MDELLRDGIYCRVSRKHQKKSLPEQEKYVLNFCKDNRYNVVRIFTHDVCEKGIWDRPGIKEVEEAFKNNEIDRVIAKKIDRFADEDGVEHYLSKGFRLHTVLEGIDSGVDLICFRGVLYKQGISNKDWSRKTKTRIGRERTGYYKGKYGFRKGEPVRDLLLVARRIFSLYLYDHLSCRNIAVKLNADGISSPQGRKWSAQQVNNILRDSIYVEYDIVSEYEFKRVQDRLSLKGIRGYKHMLDGRLKCSECQEVMKLSLGKYSCKCGRNIDKEFAEEKVVEKVYTSLNKMLQYMFPTALGRYLSENVIEERLGYFIDDPLKVTIKSSIVRKTVKSFIPLELGKYVEVRGSEVFVHGLLISEIKKILEFESSYLVEHICGDNK